MSLSKSESDVILNRANVALARSQRLVASWLPAQTEDELTHTKSEEELQREEDEIFTAVPETLGIGAPLPEKAADGSWNRTELSSNDQLRKQLLGKNYQKFMKAAAASPKTGLASSQAERTTASITPTNNNDDDDDDDEGRAAMVGKKRKPNTKRPQASAALEIKPHVEGDVDEPGSTKEASARTAPSKGRKKATSYLDEILAERAKKRKKR
ncbi:uncharacterized protein N7459_006076 [Penicillium hispanicum]|uniref:uncharacterized protein n=1 Tax=Penicillium hispanicum TaxID=1080232 RepID=UPI002540250A|nr:uncharacterized protein N7459_006076 [Penicillium hispanicum]KAJ5580091.1 hypothetical protein N7459_006076 [Penicillium hispanicum]